jgi:hypothetical protein
LCDIFYLMFKKIFILILIITLAFIIYILGHFDGIRYANNLNNLNPPKEGGTIRSESYKPRDMGEYADFEPPPFPGTEE